MTLLKSWSNFDAADWRKADAAGATVAQDPALGAFVHFTTTGSRCESRLLLGGQMRWWPQTGAERAMVWTERMDALSVSRWLVTMQMKAEPDDTHPAGAPVTPTRAYDGEKGRWKGPQMMAVRGDTERALEVMSLAELLAAQGVWIDRMHAEISGRGPGAYVRSAWKIHGATTWQRNVIDRGPNTRSLSGMGPLTFTLGVYGGDTTRRSLDVLIAPGPRLFDNVPEAEAAIGIGAIVPPPPPDTGDPCASIRTALAQTVSDLNGAREARDQATARANAAEQTIADIRSVLDR